MTAVKCFPFLVFPNFLHSIDELEDFLLQQGFLKTIPWREKNPASCHVSSYFVLNPACHSRSLFVAETGSLMYVLTRPTDAEDEPQKSTSSRCFKLLRSLNQFNRWMAET